MSALLDQERERGAAAVSLALFASPAVLIDPGLLRAIRLDVLPELGAAAEADLWFGPLVAARGPDGITLEAGAAAALRAELRALWPADPRVERAWAAIEARHAALSPALALEERVAWLWIQAAPAAEIERELGRAVRALSGGGREGLAAWAAGAWRRLPGDARESRTGRVLRQAAPPELRPAAAAGDAGLDGLDLSAALAHLPRVALPFRREGEALVLGEADPDDPVAIPVPDTDPRFVELRYPDMAHLRVGSVDVAAGEAVWRRVGTGPVELRTAVGDMFEAPMPLRIRALEGATRVSVLAFAPYGRRLAGAGDQVWEWDLDGGAPKVIHKLLTAALAYGPRPGEFAYGGDEGQLQLESGDGAGAVSMRVGDPAIRCLAYDAGGTVLAVGRADGAVTLRVTGGPREPARVTPRTVLHEGGVVALAFAREGALASAGADGVHVWEPESWVRIASIAVPGVLALAFSPDGARLAGAVADGSVQVWEPGTGEPVARLLGLAGAAHGVAFTPDGLRLVAGGDDAAVWVWDAQTWEPVGTIPAGPVSALALQDERLLATAGPAGGPVLWDLAGAVPIGRRLAAACVRIIGDEDACGVVVSPREVVTLARVVGPDGRVTVEHDGERIEARIARRRGAVALLALERAVTGGQLLPWRDAPPTPGTGWTGCLPETPRRRLAGTVAETDDTLRLTHDLSDAFVPAGAPVTVRGTLTALLSGVSFSGTLEAAPLADLWRETGSLVIVSAAPGDDEWDRRFRAALVRSGLSVWTDAMVHAEASVARQIADARARAVLALVLVSPDYVAWDHGGGEELPDLVARGVRLFPVLLRECDWPAIAPLARSGWTPHGALAESGDIDAHIEEIVDGVAAIVAGEVPIELRGVPPLPRGFVARPERERPLEALLGASTQPVGLHGPPGIGKTVMAADLARDPSVAARFPDGVVWLDAGPEPEVLGLLALLGVPGADPSSVEDAIARLHVALDGLRCLLVLDGVETASAAAALPTPGASWRVLLTTRDVGLPQTVGARPMRVEPLSGEDARLLAARSAGMEPRTVPQSVLERARGVPLALAVAGADARHAGGAWQERSGVPLDLADPVEVATARRSLGALDPGARESYRQLVVFQGGEWIDPTALERLTVVTLSELMGVLEPVGLLDTSRSSGDFRVPLAAAAALALDVDDARPAHARLLDGYRNRIPPGPREWWRLPPDEPYIWDRLLFHLRAAGDRAAATATVTDLRFLAVRIQRGGSDAALDDLRGEAGVAEALYRELSERPIARGVPLREVAGILAGRLAAAPESFDVRSLEDLIEPKRAALLERYVPVLRYDSDESVFAASAAMMTDAVAASGEPNRLLREDGTVLASAAPAGAEAQLSLDFLRPDRYPGGAAVSPSDHLALGGDDPRADAARMQEDPRYADRVYGRAVRDREGRMWLQYWLFYYVDRTSNLAARVVRLAHEGDWEMVQIRLDASDRPDLATYAVRNDGKSHPWKALELLGDAPVIYVGCGSHACYHRPGRHGLERDRADGKGRELRPALEPLGEWARWPGRWGAGPRTPRGPALHAQWDDPLALGQTSER